ncbi:MAG: hypothetical protein A2444_01960 [Candidatus Staskawiczbacteria bacterium RIFOXYC2_FULL_37_19]|nr:MAG: hypothetical protein A2444_01960 [Candidatus Staskawiczbacteria bacterium RIFOXYC2_FULL_37_19]
MKINSNIFKSYDIRGIYPSELNEESAFEIGRAFARQNNVKKAIIGRDARLSSPLLFNELAKGILAEGGQVFDIGQTLTECLYFAVGNYGFDAGIMVTASHNPKDYNGFKMLKKAGNNLHGLCPLAVPDITCPIVLTPRSCIIESCTQLFLAPVSIKAIPIFGCGIVCPV